MAQKAGIIETCVSTALSIYYDQKFRNPETRKLLEVANATKLCNSNLEYPRIIKTEPLPNGTRYTWLLVAGVTFTEFLTRKQYFENWTSSKIDIYPTDKPVLIMDLLKAELSTQEPYNIESQPLDMLAPLPIGILPSGNLYWVDLGTLPNLLIGGIPNQGKTTWLIGATLALLKANCHVCAIDLKRIDFPPLKDYFNVAETEGEAYTLILQLLAENQTRQSIIQQTPFMRKIQDNTNLFRPIVLIVDEASAITNKNLYEGIITLMTMGRASGIWVIIATQKPSAELWDKRFSTARDMCAGRICFYVPDNMISQIILGKGNSSGARLPMIKGRTSCVIGDNEFIAQTMLITPHEAEHQIPLLNTTPYFAEIEATEPPPKPKRGRPKGSTKKKEEN